ncbi:hypothetical protein H0H93_015087 [Arthromyces matolae]|nr:hypothetical protein H0H93_015087 [Arthromyces matolae]
MPLVTVRTIPWPKDLSYDKQSVIVPGTKRPGQTGVWGLIGNNTPNVLLTLYEIFESGLSSGRDQPFLGHRPMISKNPLKFAHQYVWQTYGEVDTRRRNLGSALASLFAKGTIGGGELNTVGIWSNNRPGKIHSDLFHVPPAQNLCEEWQIIDIALQSYNMVSVSLYDTLGKDSVEYIIHHAHLTVIFATSDHIPMLLKLANKVPFLKLIACIDDLTPEASQVLNEWAASQNVQIRHLRDLEAEGRMHALEPIRVKPDAIASICYTSGTTSNPKGVSNLALATQSNLYGLSLPEAATLLSYLPLAHIYERICELCTITIGGRIGYFTGDPLRLLEDAQSLKPDFFPSVPRVLNRVYQSAMAAGNVPGLKGNLFRTAIATKLQNLHNTGNSTHFLWDKLVFRKIQAVLGGQIKLLTSGSAPISPDVMDFLKIAFGCEVAEGWPNDPSSSGTVGPPQPVNEVKLVDVPGMGYTSEDKPHPRGELCVPVQVHRNNNYIYALTDEENTKATVDEEGWLHTGDVAAIDEAGRLKIIDRVKNIMKLAQGEYVALEKIENTYSCSPLIAQLYIHGDSLQSYLLGVIIPDPTQLASLASKIFGKKVSPEDLQTLAIACKDKRVNEEALSLLTKEAKRNGLKGFEMIKRIHLSLDAFTIEDGTLTPTMKIRRKDAYSKFKTELDGLYALGEPLSSSSSRL